MRTRAHLPARTRRCVLIALLAAALPLLDAGVRPDPAGAGLLGGAAVPAGMTQHDVRLPNGDVMHYLTLGPDSGKPILFVHGYPTSSFLYRKVMDQVCGGGQRTYRCIAVDQIGFGSSSCPGDGSAVSPAYEADRLSELIDALDLRDFALVVHDWGGPTGVAAGLRHADRMSHLIVLNTSLRFGSQGLLGPVQSFTDVLTSGNLTLIRLTYPAIVDFVMQDFTSTWMPWSVRAVYTAPFQDWRSGACRVRASLNLFAKAPQSEPLYTEIEDGLTTAWKDKPAQFLWGSDDVLMGPSTAMGRAAHEEWATLLPQAGTVVIDGADHFMQEDRPVEIGREIVRFVGA